MDYFIGNEQIYFSINANCKVKTANNEKHRFINNLGHNSDKNNINWKLLEYFL